MIALNRLRASGLMAGLLLIVAPVQTACAQSPTTNPADGEWIGSLELDAGTHHLTIVLKAADSTVTGTVYDGGQVFGEVEQGTLAADTVRFFVDKLRFTGVIRGSTMKVALIVYNGSTRNFVMTRKPAEPGGSHAPGD